LAIFEADERLRQGCRSRRSGRSELPLRQLVLLRWADRARCSRRAIVSTRLRTRGACWRDPLLAPEQGESAARDLTAGRLQLRGMLPGTRRSGPRPP
jgi:hypothetical protein